MRGFERNVRYAVRRAGEIAAITYGCSLLLNLYFFLLPNAAEIHSLTDVVLQYLSYSVFLGSVMIIFYAAVGAGTYFHMMLACGSTRKCAAAGIVTMAGAAALMHIVIFAVLALIAAALFPEAGINLEFVLQAVVSYLLAVGVGVIAGAVVSRFGKIGYYLIVGVTSLFMGVAYGYLMGRIGGFVTVFPFALLRLFLGESADMVRVYWCALSAAVVLIVLGSALLLRVTRRTEVRI